MDEKNIISEILPFTSTQNNGYIEIENFSVNGSHIKAWYDITKHQFIYPKNNVEDFNCAVKNPCFDLNNLLILDRKEDSIYYYTPTNHEIYYQANLEGNIEKVMSNVKQIQFSGSHKFIAEIFDGHILTFNSPRDKNLIAIKHNNITIDQLKNIANEYNYSINDEVSLFDNEGRLQGWYLKASDEIVNKDSKKWKDFLKTL